MQPLSCPFRRGTLHAVKRDSVELQSCALNLPRGKGMQEQELKRRHWYEGRRAGRMWQKNTVMRQPWRGWGGGAQLQAVGGRAGSTGAVGSRLAWRWAGGVMRRWGRAGWQRQCSVHSRRACQPQGAHSQLM
jgi:hypothetical protein